MLAAHYRASDIASGEGAVVQVWNDTSGNARHLMSPQGAALRREINGRPALKFTGAPGEGYVSEWAGFGGAFTVYVVVQTSSTDSDILSGSDGANLFFLYDRSANWSGFQGGAQRVISPSSRRPTVLAYSTNGAGAASALSCDLTAWKEVAFTGLPAAAGASQLFVGRASDAGTRYLNGSLAEVLVFDEAHSAATMRERARQLAYDYEILMPPATSWAPAYEQHGPVTRVTAAYVVSGLLDRWFRQPLLPIAETPLSRWLMDEVGYVKPAPPSAGGGAPVPTTGRIYPGGIAWAPPSDGGDPGPVVTRFALTRGVGEGVLDAPLFVVTQVAVDAPARIRFYSTPEGRAADLPRTIYTPYPGGRCLIFELNATEPGTFDVPFIGKSPLLWAADAAATITVTWRSIA